MTMSLYRLTMPYLTTTTYDSYSVVVHLDSHSRNKYP